jgi:hypothetical protein
MNTNTTQLLASLKAANNKRELNKVLREIAKAFYIALSVGDFKSSEVLGEKLGNYNFDISPYSPR